MLDWFLVSVYAQGLLFDTIISTIILLFLITKKKKTTATWWLAGFFAGEGFLFGAYFASFSIFADWGAFHRYFSALVIFGLFSLIGFSYYYPKNDHPKESKIVIPLTFILAVTIYIHFIYKTINMDKIYSFDAHIFTFDFGSELGIVIMLYYLIGLVILLRKTIGYSEYRGWFNTWERKPKSLFSIQYIKYIASKPLIGISKITNPVGKDAEACRGFAIPIFLHILVSIANIMVKINRIDYHTYALIFSYSTVVIIYYIAIIYINNSTEPTSFMVKLVGVSLGTVLAILCYSGTLNLSVKEQDYDEKKLMEVNTLRKNIIAGNFIGITENMQYVIAKPISSGYYSKDYNILYPTQNFIIDDIIYGEEKEVSLLVSHEVPTLKRKYKLNSEEELTKLALEKINSKKKKELVREYRRAKDQFYTTYSFFHNDLVYEVGYNYKEYRKEIHFVGVKQVWILLLTTLVVLTFFPYLFRRSLVRPLKKLLFGVERVNLGDLTVDVPVKYQDEIGFLTANFNSMVSSIRDARNQLQQHAEQLEDKVKERTKEVEDKMTVIHAMKVQQDGDYFLTSLLAKPLFFNANKSQIVKTTFVIKQKKQFEFKNKKGELGGDICITGNLRLGIPTNYKRYVMAMNADAMGKSMQGAGGSLVMGVVMNSIMARSAANDKVLDQSPVNWLMNTYNELQSVFKAFDGSMAISATIFLIEETTGNSWYFNAEHPFTVLYRDNIASFIENNLQIRKIGLDSEYDFSIKTFKLLPGDILLIGSDGKDDLNLTAGGESRSINENEKLFLSIVEKADADVKVIIEEIQKVGEVIDDISILKIEYNPPFVSESDIIISSKEENIPVSPTLQKVANPDQIFMDAKSFFTNGELDKAIEIMYQYYQKDKSNSKINKLLGLISFKKKDYNLSAEVLVEYLKVDPNNEELIYYLAMSYKKLSKLIECKIACSQLLELNPNNTKNLVLLSETCRLLGEVTQAQLYAQKVLEIDPENINAKRIIENL